MKILKSWLQDYTKLSLTDSELSEIFSLRSGFDVDDIQEQLDENIVVARIEKISAHPNADRLRLAQVYDGKQNYDVVCGAPNIAEGMVAPFAKIGARVGDITIAAAEIRGQKSYGMLCSEHELGISDDHSGIMELPAEYELGQSLGRYIESDAVFDLEVTPNRGDCLSHFGIAREVLAVKGSGISHEPITLNMSAKPANDSLSVEIKNLEMCPRYMARVINNVKIAPSPEWLQKRLIALGLAPINNVVDVTNYIMFDLGQPLHAFDSSKIGNKIIVRSAKKAERIVALDGVEHELSQNDILIANPAGPIAIAGIMGGVDSGITESTTSIVLESAEFNFVNIRKTSKRLNLPSEASYRFERGVDSGNLEYALNAAAKLVQELAGGSILKGVVQAGVPYVDNSVKIDYAKINTLLGLSLSNDEINHYLKLLGFKISANECRVPSWRKDISLIEDLAEEVGRIYGYNQITPLDLSKAEKVAHTNYYFKEWLKDILVALGFSEQYSYPFLSEEDVKLLDIKKEQLVSVKNPVQQDNKYMRISLIPGLLKNIAKNASFDEIKLFEINPVYLQDKELWMLSICICGKKSGEIEKIVSTLAKKLNISEKLFSVTRFAREDLTRYKVKKAYAEVAEVEINKLLKATAPDWQKASLKVPGNEIIYRPVSKFPALTRDLAFIVNARIDAQEIAERIYATSALVNRVELFDEYVSDKFGRGKKNLAYHIYLQAMDRTLQDDKANEVVSDIVKAIESAFKAKFRDN